eukprot:6880447-Prymnesium_polylepis.1
MGMATVGLGLSGTLSAVRASVPAYFAWCLGMRALGGGAAAFADIAAHAVIIDAMDPNGFKHVTATLGVVSGVRYAPG